MSWLLLSLAAIMGYAAYATERTAYRIAGALVVFVLLWCSCVTCTAYA